MRRLAALLLGLVTPLALLTPASAATAQAAESSGAISWTPCPEDPTAECGTLAVPIDWKRPASGTFDVAVARRRAADPAARIGALVLGAGGPGGSGVDLVLYGAELFSPELLRRFDLVSLDPRGTNRSHPVVCSTDLMAQEPDPIMKSQADFDRRLAYNERLRADCRARTGPLFDHVDSLSTVADLDAFRAALGEERLSFYGGSYGTLLGQQYAERHPRRVRAFTLDSTMDHSLDTQGFMDTEAWGAQDAFDEFTAWCERDSRCLQHGEDVRAFWRALLARADRGELPAPGQPEVKVTAFMLIDAATGYFYTPASWLPFSELLAALDSGGAMPQGALPLMSPPADRAQEVTPNPTQILCLDFRLPVRDYREYGRHLRRMAKIAPDMRYSPLSFVPVVSCLGQPDPIPNPQHRLKVRTDTPVLVVNSKHDPATVYPWATSTTRQLGRSGRLLTYEGWGHIAYFRGGTCVTQAVDSYLISQTLPARGASCPAVPPADETDRLHKLRELGTRLPGTPGWAFPF
ncbi:alpha/beta hydrolase [Streptosporangium carneum]|uniref:Peptidase n=1 Tax=Streptosporangium carneum TaxID=47481 RepID=A0A9W6MFH8_9ACTN|nr:alpha/beta hydrolase [Streptosporangium carneum]GLK11893.1 peptidase [Streptosporangium carneum]